MLRSHHGSESGSQRAMSHALAAARWASEAGEVISPPHHERVAPHRDGEAAPANSEEPPQEGEGAGVPVPLPLPAPQQAPAPAPRPMRIPPVRCVLASIRLLGLTQVIRGPNVLWRSSARAHRQRTVSYVYYICSEFG